MGFRAFAMARMLAEEKTFVNARDMKVCRIQENPEAVRRTGNVTEQRQSRKYRMDFWAISQKL